MVAAPTINTLPLKSAGPFHTFKSQHVVAVEIEVCNSMQTPNMIFFKKSNFIETNLVIWKTSLAFYQAKKQKYILQCFPAVLMLGIVFPCFSQQSLYLILIWCIFLSHSILFVLFCVSSYWTRINVKQSTKCFAAIQNLNYDNTLISWGWSITVKMLIGHLSSSSWGFVIGQICLNGTNSEQSRGK